tara:strand:- start:43 stop:654 length:612 start_codon:yes stop_codon:yes gene_type:complete
MPKVPTDYSKTCIYKLVHKDDVDNENIYIGSTTDFRNRKHRHKYNCNSVKHKESEVKKYQYIRDNGGWDNWVMVEIEKYPCNDKREAETRERYWIEHYKSTLNDVIPTGTTDLDYKKTKCKKYYGKYKDKILENRKTYYQEKSEEIKQRRKQYYKENSDIILQKEREKITCECGCLIRKSDISQHKKTAKHQKLMSEIITPSN